MARNAFWRGYLKLSLVNCPVTLTPATTESEKVRFHTINRKSGRRVRMRYVDAETGKAVADEIRGYETGEGAYVTFDDDELASVALESVRTIDIESFVASDSIPWIWYDSPYFVAPSDKVGEEAFAVIREAMRARDVVGISRLVMNRREHAVLLEPRDRGIVLWTLRYGDEVRDPRDYFKDLEAEAPDGKMLELVGDLIAKRQKAWDPAMVEDPVQLKLLDIIAARKKSTKPSSKAKDVDGGDEKGDEKGDSSNVISLMDALKKSLEKKPSGSTKKSARKR